MRSFTDTELERMFTTFLILGVTLAQLRSESYEQVMETIYASNYPLHLEGGVQDEMFTLARYIANDRLKREIDLSKFRWVVKTMPTGVPYREADISLLFQYLEGYCADFQVTIRSYPRTYSLAYIVDVAGDPGQYAGDDDFIAPLYPTTVHLFRKIPHLEFDLNAEEFIIQLANRLKTEIESQLGANNQPISVSHYYPLYEMPDDETLAEHYESVENEDYRYE